MTASPVRRVAGAISRRLRPPPEVAALRHAERLARRVPRHVPGTIALGPYRIAYSDLRTLCPQWRDIFVDRVLQFETSAAAPRILDCGANIGLASLGFKARYPGARITAYEADPALAGLCRRNLEANGHSDVEVVSAAVWTAAGDVEFVCEGADSGTLASLDTGVEGARTRVPAVRLRDVLDEKVPVDLLKLDIEGAELAVLEDCADRLGEVRALLMDLHEFDATRRVTGRVLDLLTSAGFAVALDRLVPLPWRRGAVGPGPFAGAAVQWACLVRAWRT